MTSESGWTVPRRLIGLTRPVLAAVIAALPFIAAGSCSRSSSERPTESVVVYVSADEVFARPILAAFEKATGIRVDAKFDTEATKTTGLANLLRSERSRPRADAFWSSEVFMTVQLAEEGILAPHHSAIADGWPEAMRDDEARWFGFAARGRVIVYAPDRVQVDQVPTAWTDLSRDWWKGRLVMADPRFGTTRGHLGAMKVYWDETFMPGYYNAFLEGLRDNEIRLLTTGNAGVVEAVASGEADAGMTDTDDVWAGQARGFKVEAIAARHDPDPTVKGGGTLLIPNTVARIAGGSNAAAAARFIDFMLSPEVELMLLESDSHNVPVLPDRLPPAAAALVERYRIDDPLKVDYATVAEAMDGAVERAMRELAN